MIMDTTYDFAVIGGGSAGYAAASTAVGLGLKTVVIEGGRDVGGLCILRGCMPSKTLIESADRFITIRRATEFGLRTGKLSFDADEIIARKKRLVAEFADYRLGQLESGRFGFVRGRARFEDAHTLVMEGADAGRIRAKTFLIATGSKVQPVALPGLVETGYLDSDAVLDSPRIPKSVIVLGGGATALEFAHFYEGMGSAVTVIQRSAQFLREMDADVTGALAAGFSKRGIRMAFGTRLLRAERAGDLKRVWFEQDGSEKSAEAEEIIFALGRVPQLDGLALDRAGIALEKGRLITSPQQQTSVKHIFSAGDATGPFEIVHIAIQQGEIAARNAARLIRSSPEPLEETDYRLKLSVVFTKPEVATIGMSERELTAAGIPFLAAQYPFNDHGKSLVMGETDGFVKLIVAADSREILGAAVVGPHASDLIHEIAVAMHFRACASDLARIPHYHPTLSEIWTYPAEELA
jgi:pyruvate/2-oxoglutarate dehydrogenase complex dihydrolipoamide dehydrogenase (E3) component